MKFFKENSGDIVRLILNQFALGVFGIVLVFASTMANDSEYGAFSLIASIFSILFYMYILYVTLQEMGAKHRIKVEGGKLISDKHRGLKLMLWAQLPNFVLIFFMFLGTILAYAGAESVGVNMYTIVELILFFFQSTFDGLFGFFNVFKVGDAPMRGMLITSICYLASTIPGILVCWGSYILGMQDKKLFSFFKKGGEKKDNETSDKQS